MIFMKLNFKIQISALQTRISALLFITIIIYTSHIL